MLPDNIQKRLNQRVQFLNLGKNDADAPQVKDVLLTLATAVGAWGGFPSPPRQFNRLVVNPLVQYALVFILLMQGGSGKNWKLAGIVTALMYALHMGLDT